jgi:hypothetical protein
LAQEAVEVHFEGEDVEIPSPTAIEEHASAHWMGKLQP